MRGLWKYGEEGNMDILSGNGPSFIYLLKEGTLATTDVAVRGGNDRACIIRMEMTIDLFVKLCFKLCHVTRVDA
jgi:hypothetical protein